MNSKQLYFNNAWENWDSLPWELWNKKLWSQRDHRSFSLEGMWGGQLAQPLLQSRVVMRSDIRLGPVVFRADSLQAPCSTGQAVTTQCPCCASSAVCWAAEAVYNLCLFSLQFPTCVFVCVCARIPFPHTTELKLNLKYRWKLLSSTDVGGAVLFGHSEC